MARPIRPMQGYLFKLPSGFLELFGVPPTPLPMPAIMSSSHQGLGDDYRTADEILTIPRVDPFAVDPALVERGVRGHAVTQNGLAGYVRSLGLEPRSPRPVEPNFDVHGNTAAGYLSRKSNR
jgi:hypothetical protein